MGKRVFVTGAEGFIGSHLTELLVRANYDVSVLCQYTFNNSHGWLDTLPAEVRSGLRVTVGDVRDSDQVHELVKGHDAVVHLAALISIPYSYRSPKSYFDTNVLGTLNILNAVRNHAVSRLLITSTSEVYGSAQSIPMSEAHPILAQSPYAASKTAADQLAHSFFLSFGTPVVIIRPFNVYGPRQSMRAVISSILHQAVHNNGTIRVGSLTPTRDFTFVADTIEAFRLSLEVSGIEGTVFNIGSGFEISVLDILQMVREILGDHVSWCSDEDRKRPINSEVNRLLADSTRASSQLNWHPRLTGLDGFREGLTRTLSWFESQAVYLGHDSERYHI